MADATLIQQYEKLAQASAKQADVAGKFSKAFDAAGIKKAREQKIAESNARVKESMKDLKGDIDYTTTDDPTLTKALTSWATGRKNQFADDANNMATINDPSSSEHMALADDMNNINNEFVSVREEMNTLNALQEEYKTIMMSEEGFSAGADPEIVEAFEAIFTPGGGANVKIEGGHIIYEVNGKEYSAKDLKLPTRKAFDQAGDILSTNATFRQEGKLITPESEQALTNQYKTKFSNEDQLRSILSDGDFGDVIPTEDIDIEEMGFEPARDLFISRLVQANKEAAKAGYNEQEKERRRKLGDQRTTKQKDYDAAVQRVKRGFEARVPFKIDETTKVIPSGSGWKVMEWDPVEKVWTESEEKQRKTLSGIVGLIPIS